MKLKTRIMPELEYDALFRKIRYVPCIINSPAGTTIAMVTGDFEPSQNMAEIRWILTESHMDSHLFQVDGIGDAILIIPDYS